MPLTKVGKKVKKAMKKEYGKRKGTDVFYGYENKNSGRCKRKSGDTTPK